jgi:hypothetical protein
MPSTYEPIAAQTVSGSSVLEIEFTSIPSTYTDLILITSGTSTANIPLNITFNGSTTGYSGTALGADGSSIFSFRRTNQDKISDFNMWTTSTANVINIMNYSNSTTYKTVIGRNNSIGGSQRELDIVVGLWQSTSAITSIKLTNPYGGYYYSIGSTFTLYGIKAA